MDDSVRRLLGMRKKVSFLYLLWDEIRRHFSIRVLTTISILLFFMLSIFLFANYEIMQRPDILEKYGSQGMNPYFISLYWFITTVATVGYGDITPITMKGILVALMVMLSGVMILSLIISQVTSRIVSMNLGSMFGVTRTRKKIDCIICGWNPTSESAFNELTEPGFEIVIIDKVNRPELAKTRNVHFLAGDPTNPDTLKRANIKNAKSVVLAMEEDSEVLLAIHVIRDLNPWINIVAKINNHEHVKVAESAGADQVVSPPSIGGRLLSMFADEPSAVNWVIRATSAEKGIKLTEYRVTNESPFVNKTLAQIRHEIGNKAKIIGVDTAEGFEKIPGDDLKIEAGNKLIMIIDTNRFIL